MFIPTYNSQLGARGSVNRASLNFGDLNINDSRVGFLVCGEGHLVVSLYLVKFNKGAEVKASDAGSLREVGLCLVLE